MVFLKRVGDKLLLLLRPLNQYVLTSCLSKCTLSEHRPLLMESSFEVLEDDIRDLIKEAYDHVKGLPMSTDKAAKYNMANDAIGYSLKLLHDYRIQASGLSSRTEKEHHLSIIDSLQQGISSVRENLLAHKSYNSERRPQKHVVGSTLTMARDIQEMQEKSLTSLKRSEQVVQCTEELGAEASTRLKQQRDKFYEIDQGLDTIGSQIQRARKEMNAFVRRMMRDKVVVFFSLVIFVALVIALFVKYRNSKRVV